MKNGLYIEYGIKRWYKNNKYHRDDGPAIEYANDLNFGIKIIIIIV